MKCPFGCELQHSEAPLGVEMCREWLCKKLRTSEEFSSILQSDCDAMGRTIDQLRKQRNEALAAKLAADTKVADLEEAVRVLSELRERLCAQADEDDTKIAGLERELDEARAKWAKVEEALSKDSWSQITAKAALYDEAKARAERAERLLQEAMREYAGEDNDREERDLWRRVRAAVAPPAKTSEDVPCSSG